MSGKLGATNLSANSDTVLYTAPSNTFAVATINIVNRSGSTITARIAICDADAPTNAEYIEFDVGVAPKGVLERTGVVVGAEQRIVVRSSAVDVNAVAYGITTSTS
jgi:hypothetical protein